MSVKVVGYTDYSKNDTFSWWRHVSFPPEKLNMYDHVKGRGIHCPALTNIFKNTYIIRSPFDLHLRIQKQPNKSWWVEVLPESSLKPEAFNTLFVINPLEEQNNQDWPLLQMLTPYTFISDDDVYIELMPPLLEHKQLPGITVSGTYSIYDWHRQSNWIFEWRDITKNIHIKRGEPLFYVRFNPRDRNDKVKLKELPITDDIKNAINCDEVKNVTNNMSSLLMTHNGKYRKKRLIKSHIRYILDRFISRNNH